MNTTENGALAGIVTDLITEQQALEDVVSAAPDASWQLPTDSPGWTVADQIAHLAFFDRAAAIAITDPGRFNEESPAVRATFTAEDTALDDLTLSGYRQMSAGELLADWRAARSLLAEAAATLADGDRVAWYGPSMSARSFLTARLMEVWAHGADVAKALGVARPDTDRLRHIVTLGVLTRAWSYINRGLQPSESDVRVELTAPSGDVWTYGPADASDSVTGSAGDFCRVVTQRAHVDDTGLKVNGAAAREWMELAQCFAGRPTDGPAPRAKAVKSE